MDYFIIVSILYLLVFMLGASVFSFLGVVAYRVPRKLSFVKGRSFCPECGKKLSFAEMIPVFSYILLRGKCRACKTRIRVSCLLSEIAGGLFSLFSFIMYASRTPDACGFFRAGVFFALVCVLYLVTLVDAETCEIPNGFIAALAVVSVISFFAFGEITWLDRLIGIFSVSVPLLLIALLIDGAFGGGDIKLMAAAGLFCGWKLNLIALFSAVLTGGIYAIFLLLSHKKTAKEHFAFGPFLCAGIFISFAFGDFLLSRYLSLFGL